MLLQADIEAVSATEAKMKGEALADSLVQFPVCRFSGVVPAPAVVVVHKKGVVQEVRRTPGFPMRVAYWDPSSEERPEFLEEDLEDLDRVRLDLGLPESG